MFVVATSGIFNVAKQQVHKPIHSITSKFHVIFLPPLLLHNVFNRNDMRRSTHLSSARQNFYSLRALERSLTGCVVAFKVL